jgi:hypothetical protein
MIMKTSKNDPKSKKRLVEASGGYYKNNDNSISNKHITSATAVMPVTKNAQYAGSGANVAYTQPMFFSPLHTPQNWQIASKRRECYQWLFANSTEVVTSNFTYKKLKDLDFLHYEKITDTLTGGYLYTNIDSEFILGATGQFRKPIHFSERECINKRFFKFNSYGNYRTLSVSEEHPLVILDGEIYRHKIKLEKNDIYRRTIGIPIGTKKIKIPDKLIVRKEAKDVSKKDFLLTPLPECGKVKIDSDLAWSIGLCIADGTIGTNKNTVAFTHSKNEKHIEHLEQTLNNQFVGKIGSRQHGDGNGWRTSITTKESHDIYSDYIERKLTNKRFTLKTFNLDKESRLCILGGYFDGDGSYNQSQCFLIANNYSKDMADQIYWLLLSCGIVCSLNYFPLYREHYDTSSKWCYRITIPSSEAIKLSPYMKSDKVPVDFIPKKQRQLRFLYTENSITYLAQPIYDIKEFRSNEKGYDIQVDPERSFIADGYICSNCRFYYENEGKIAAGIDFYSTFPVNGFKLECKSKKILKYYERVVKRLKINHWLKLMSHEYFLLGDVFPFVDISCPTCAGSGVLKDGSVCSHKDGTINRILVLNPDWISVEDNILASEPMVVLVPDEELKMIVQKKEPRQIYNRLPVKLIEMVASGRPIPLSNRCVSHLKHNSSPYGKYGTSLLRRCFTVLAYKTKLMTANWIVAERLIIPIRVVQIGDEKRPASQEDIQDVSNQLAAVANDPNLTLITHHLFKYEYIGATGKIHNITAELEQIGKEILDGLMLNQAILNGDASSYSSAQVGVEVMIRRLDSWRATLAEWVENHIFLPIAMMQGFIDEDESKSAGETIYLHPTIKWNDLQLRDQSNKLQMLMGLHDKKIISTQTLLENFDLDVDQELQRLREESVMASATGQLAGGGGMDMGMGGMGGGMPGGMGGMGGPPPGGGMPGVPGMPGSMPGGMTGAPGGPGGMPGAAPMGGPGMGSPGGASMGGMADSLPSNLKIGKRGKHGKTMDEQMKAPPPTYIHLTKLEQQMYKALVNLDVPYKLFGQYKVAIQNNAQPFVLDFAYPEIGVGTECLHPETLVPTKNGVKDAKDITIEDKLIGKNGDLVNIERLISHNYTGNILTIKALGLDPFKVTENHPILISKTKKIRIPRNNRFSKKWTREYISFDKPEFIEANNIKNGYYFLNKEKFIMTKLIIWIYLNIMVLLIMLTN